ncbi:glycosyl transferase [Edaphobacter sp. HDX4]
MGDVLHALPAVVALRKAHPDWFIGWVIEPRWRPLMSAVMADSTQLPVIDCAYPAHTREWSKRPFSTWTVSDIARLRRLIRSDRFDLCVDLQGSIRSATIGKLAGAGQFAGPAEPREMPARWLYGRRLQTKAVHVIEQACEWIGDAVGEFISPVPIDFPIDEDAEKKCKTILNGLMAEKQGYALIAPTAGWGAKQWPAERFGAVASKLGKLGIPSLVNASAPGDLTARRVVETSEGYAAMARADIPLLIELTRRASVVIAGDTGPLHLAAALRRPVVALFGPTDPARNGPYGTMARVLRHGGARRDHRRLAEPEAGLLEITVDEVADAAIELLKGPQLRRTGQVR